MPTYFEIPLTPQAQYFSISLGGTSYYLSFQYRDAPVEIGPGWIMDVYDATGARLVCGIPLVLGANLLAPYDYLGFQGAMIVTSDDGNPPTYPNLGLDSHVYWVTLP